MKAYVCFLLVVTHCIAAAVNTTIDDDDTKISYVPVGNSWGHAVTNLAYGGSRTYSVDGSGKAILVFNGKVYIFIVSVVFNE